VSAEVEGPLSGSSCSASADISMSVTARPEGEAVIL